MAAGPGVAFIADRVANHTGVCRTLTGRTEEALTGVSLEVQSARQSFPDSRRSMTALVEEVGELAKALLDETPERATEEAIQVAAMARSHATGATSCQLA
jgi:hypothetical protein